MPTLSMAQVAGYAAGAGITGEAGAIATAIAWAESKGDSDAVGDVALESATWGPSIGLWQIRSLNAQRGTGGQRDEVANRDPGTNARNMAAISKGGKSWSAWSTYTSGKYRAYLGQARMAAQNPSAVSSGTIPLNPVAGSVDLLAGGTWARFGLFILGGALVGMALYNASGVESVVGTVAKTVAKVAA